MELESVAAGTVAGHSYAKSADTGTMSAAQAALRVRKRDNQTVVTFNPDKISIAITRAYLHVEGGQAAASRRIHDLVATLTAEVVALLSDWAQRHGNVIHVEDIQNFVELALMRNGHYPVARQYILYREERHAARQIQANATTAPPAPAPSLHVILANGSRTPLEALGLPQWVAEACLNLSHVSAEVILADTRRNLFDGVSIAEVFRALILSARSLIEREPEYSYVAARLLDKQFRVEAAEFLGLAHLGHAARETLYIAAFPAYIEKAIEHELLSAALRDFDLTRLAAALLPERDMQFTYLGLQTLYDRYFLHHDDVRFELPQIFFMRVAMGLALEESDKNGRAIEFYRLLSSFDYMSSTPTLFNSGTPRSQLSSCFLTTVADDLDQIYGAIKDNALLSKFAGGLGNDWTNVRAMNSYIKGTNGKSQGVVPFLKVANDTAVAVNQGGKRKGAVCAYLETWHLDIEEFIELRKNTGDERRRTHDMNTANWIPDLFIQRVLQNANWTLFSPNETPDLHDRYGEDFVRAYTAYEAMAAAGKIRNFKSIPAINLWRKMLGLIFETGHPWMTFKDPCNLRSPQQHVGVIHSSNLCTEITLNTNAEEIAVCNLGSINLAQHVTSEGLDIQKLRQTVNTAIRMLDNVIDINFYAVPQARNSNLQHRPIGLGIMGFQDALYKMDIAYASPEAVEFADRSMEYISYYAIEASCALAVERGTYQTFAGSLWSQGVLPLDSLKLLEKSRNPGELLVDRSAHLDWETLRSKVQRLGMRNSNVMAIAPTATISNICGVSQSIEPTFQNLFVKSNLSGEFTVINAYLVNDLKALGLWDDVMINDLKYFDGSLDRIDRVPDALKRKYATAFEIDAEWLIEAGSRRQKWIDQSQSLNLYMAKPSGKKLEALYLSAWKRGLKTTYYLRTLAASDTEKSTVNSGTLNAVTASVTMSAQVCSLDGECESCT